MMGSQAQHAEQVRIKGIRLEEQKTVRPRLYDRRLEQFTASSCGFICFERCALRHPTRQNSRIIRGEGSDE